jgi:hypothetical protein
VKFRGTNQARVLVCGAARKRQGRRINKHHTRVTHTPTHSLTKIIGRVILLLHQLLITVTTTIPVSA